METSTVAFFVGIGVLLLLDVVKLGVGIDFSRDDNTTESKVCSHMKHVPIYLIVSARAPWYFYKVISAQGKECLYMFIAFVVFYFIWLICGSVWIYPNCTAVIIDDAYPTCNKALMGFAAVIVTTDWIYAIVISCLFCALLGQNR